MIREKFLNNLWRWKCGLKELNVNDKVNISINKIKQQQINQNFQDLMENRMIMGFFRYGDVKVNEKKYDNVGSTIKRLQDYQKTGNSEHLVDAANLCMIEFSQENHPNFHFESKDDGVHTKEIIKV